MVERLYVRLGPRLLVYAFAGCLLLWTLDVYAVLFIGNRYLDIQERDLFAFVLLSPALIAGTALTGSRRIRETYRVVRSWTGEARGADLATAVWPALIGLPRSVAALLVMPGPIFVVPGLALVMLILDEPVLAVVPLLVGVICAAAGGWFIAVIMGPVFTRPMLKDVAAFLPPDFASPVASTSVRTKLFGPLPLVAILVAITAGGIAKDTADGALGLGIVESVAVGLGLLAAVPVLVTIRSVLDPVDELTEATRRVRSGDLSTHVAITSSDELGELASSFNMMVDDLRRSRARIVEASDAARRKVERDLHDGAQQHLVLLQLRMAQLRRAHVELESELGPIHSELDTALRELRELAQGVYPQVLESAGLPAALTEAARQAALPTTVDANGTARHPSEIEAAVYFCCLEAVQNAAKHAGPGASARIELHDDDGVLTFSVRDDGRGFAHDVHEGQGLQNMRDRIGAHGGTLWVDSSPGAGTNIHGRLPLTG